VETTTAIVCTIHAGRIERLDLFDDFEAALRHAREPLSAPSRAHPLHGGCLCGGVSYEITAPFLRANFCHCSRCRKHSGAAALAQGRVPREGFRLVKGEELIRVFRPPDGMVKAFCSVCGSSLFGGTWPDGPEVSIRLGALDGDPGIRPRYHSHVGSRAAWDELPEDGLPRFETAPKSRSEVNMEIVRRHVEFANQGDYDAAMLDLANDVTLDTRGFDSPEAGIYDGPERVGWWFGNWFNRFAPGYEMVLKEVVAKGDWVLAHVHHSGRGRTSGVPVEMDAYTVHWLRDGKISRVMLFDEFERALAAAETG
jgi:hypothetical protein